MGGSVAVGAAAGIANAGVVYAGAVAAANAAGVYGGAATTMALASLGGGSVAAGGGGWPLASQCSWALPRHSRRRSGYWYCELRYLPLDYSLGSRY